MVKLSDGSHAVRGLGRKEGAWRERGRGGRERGREGLETINFMEADGPMPL